MRQPHTVQVLIREKVESRMGYRLAETGEEIALPCTFREVRGTENDANGVVADHDAYLLTQHWPTFLLNDTTPLIVFRGREYDIHGLPRVRDGSPRSAHVHIQLKYVGLRDG